MPRRSILSATERESLLALPDAKDELIRHYTFNETDLSVIRQRRGAATLTDHRQVGFVERVVPYQFVFGIWQCQQAFALGGGQD